MLRRRRLRTKLLVMLLPTVAALVALAGNGMLDRRAAAAQSRTVDRLTGVAAAASGATGALVTESALSARFVASGGEASADALANARELTDASARRLRAAVAGAASGAPAAVRDATRDALRALASLPATRAQVDELAATATFVRTPAEAVAAYGTATDRLLAVNAAIADSVADAALARQLRAYAALGRAKGLYGQEAAFLNAALERGVFAPGEYEAYVAAAARADAELDRFRADASPDEVAALDQRLRLRSLDDVEALRRTALEAGAGGEVSGDPATWFIGMTTKVGFLDEVEDVVVANVRARAAAHAEAATRAALLYAGIAGGAVALALLLAGFVLRAITVPLARLTAAAETVARQHLPRLVEQLRAPDADGTLDGLLPPVPVTGGGEVAQLAEAFNAVQRVAVDVARQQGALVRQGMGELFVNLARRNQVLVEQQLSLLDELESTETDPDALDSLFRLDHLATRMRRNGENLLVLAGAEQARRWSSPVPLGDVLRAAAGEVADFRRITYGPLEDLAVAGHVAADLAHLLAELLENATSYAPPDTTVDVGGHWLDGNYVVLVADHGVGMPRERLTAANELLARPPAPGLSLGAALGFVVAGRLAQRHHLAVRLHPSPGGGLIAAVALPRAILVTGSSERELVEDDAGELFRALRLRQRAQAAQQVLPRAAAPTASAPEPAPAMDHVVEPASPPQVGAARPPVAPGEGTPGTTPGGLPRRRAQEEAEAPAPRTAATPPEPVAPAPRTAEPPAEAEPDPLAALSALAEEASAQAGAGVTELGLVRRVPGASFPRRDAPPGHRPSPPAPEEVRSLLSSYRAGVARGRGEHPDDLMAEENP